MAVLLTWDLVTSVTTEGPGGANGTEGPAGPGVAHPGGGPAAGGFLSLGISAWRGMLRVDVYDGRRSLPARGYEIVASLADDWGTYRTPAGRAVFFTLCFLGDAHQSPRPPDIGGTPSPLSPPWPGPGIDRPTQGPADLRPAGRLIAGNTSAD
jgi:hypothetical protein